MSVLPSLLFGISASLDALLVGYALGLQKVPLPAKHNLLISAVTLIGTVISISLGNLLLPLIPGEIATRTGSSILILFGLYYAGKWLVSRWRCSSSDNSSLCREKKKFAEHRNLTLPQTLALGCAISMNNIGIGFSASITGLPFLPASISTFFCSFGFLTLGSRLGRSVLLQRVGEYADPISGLLLILLGLWQLYH